jgi:hypothetical protein
MNSFHSSPLSFMSSRLNVDLSGMPPAGYFSRSWIPLRQRDLVKRDFMTKESNQRKSCEIESPKGRPGKAGSGLRDFDGTDYAL